MSREKLMLCFQAFIGVREFYIAHFFLAFSAAFFPLLFDSLTLLGGQEQELEIEERPV